MVIFIRKCYLHHCYVVVLIINYTFNNSLVLGLIDKDGAREAFSLLLNLYP